MAQVTSEPIAEQIGTEVGGEPSKQVKILIAKSAAQIKSGDYEGAIESTDKAIALDPTAVEAYGNQGTAHAAIALGDVDGFTLFPGGLLTLD